MEVLRFAPGTSGSFQYRFNPVSENRYLRLSPAAAFRNNNSESENGRMFILGMGYVGEFVAQHLINQGWAVSGTCTSVAKQQKLNKLGFDVPLFHANHPKIVISSLLLLEVINILNQHTHLLVSIPPCKDIGDPMLQHAELLRSNLNSGCLQWLCYLSTTGVYGDCGGAWVDEDYQPNPPSELEKLRLAAEEGWLSLGHDLGLAAHVFRLGGIYGPGRSAIDTVIKPEPLSEAQRGRSFKRFTSRVHVADICNALNGCIHKPSPGRIYNVVDDDSAPRTEVFSFAYKLINEKWPSRVKKIPPPAIYESFTEKRGLRGEKRVVNARMKKELGVKLIHPSYRSGLQNICDQIHDL
ncbi:uncharacterized protein LOC143613650 [Bidens hawaiensis]|uniref:uncharacterized protein LOC143613650 n=1 Tax=Bidens hawaiensis TaxID=980011 RepID=UPI00404ABEF2